MKIKEINKLIKIHLEQPLQGYFIHKDLIYKIQNQFLICGYDFESRGDDDLDLAVWYYIQPLFIKSQFIFYNFGDRLFYKKKKGLFKSEELAWWDARKENLDNSFQSILKSILEQGEPFLNSIKTVEDFYKKFHKEKKESIRIYEAVTYSTVLFGSEDLQNKNIKELIDFCTSQIDSNDDKVEMQIREDATLLLNAVSTEKRLTILKSWSNETIGHLKLPHIEPLS